MADSAFDFSSLDAAANTAVIDTPEVVTPEAGAKETPSTEVETKQGEDSKETTEAGKETKTGEEKQTEEKVDDKPTDKAGFKEARAALKAYKDANPTDTKTISTLKNALGHAEAYQELFGSTKEARAVKETLDTIGGVEGLQTMQSTLQSVKETDDLLYAGDPKLIEHIIADLESEGRLDALGKIAPSFLDNLRQHDEAGFYKALTPHFVRELETCQVPEFIDAMWDRLNDTENPKSLGLAKTTLKGLANWFVGLKERAKTEAKPGSDKEEVKGEPEADTKTKAAQEKIKTEQATFRKEVTAEVTKAERPIVSKALIPYLKAPYFKDFGNAERQHLAQKITNQIYHDLQTDGETAKHMNLLFNSKNPDKAKLAAYWTERVQAQVDKTTKAFIKSTYPGYDKTPGKVTAKAAAPTKFNNTTPVLVDKKPKISELDMTRDPKTLLFITGRGYLPNGKYIHWKQ